VLLGDNPRKGEDSEEEVAFEIEFESKTENNTGQLAVVALVSNHLVYSTDDSKIQKIRERNLRY
jgi:hypothetical protein